MIIKFEENFSESHRIKTYRFLNILITSYELMITNDRKVILSILFRLVTAWGIVLHSTKTIFRNTAKCFNWNKYFSLWLCWNKLRVRSLENSSHASSFYGFNFEASSAELWKPKSSTLESLNPETRAVWVVYNDDYKWYPRLPNVTYVDGINFKNFER